ncbi:MAG: winged helix-turn-helix transcriptional regulator [Candidatus Thorarchaeota archaeon]
MDDIDLGILHALSENCRTSRKELASNFEISATAIRKRIKQLEEKGVIARYYIRPSRALIGSERVFVLVYPGEGVSKNDLVDRIFEYPHVSRIYFDSYGSCIVHAECTDATMIDELNQYIRSIDSVERVEIHTIPVSRGGSIIFRKNHKRILRYLLSNPREPISNLTKKLGMTSRTVRKCIDEMIDSQAIEFTIHVNLDAADVISMAFRLNWDPKFVSMDEIQSVVKSKFPFRYWRGFNSVNDNTLWCDFLVNHAREGEVISESLLEIPSITIVSTVIVYPLRKVRYIREELLKRRMSSDETQE